MNAAYPSEPPLPPMPCRQNKKEYQHVNDMIIPIPNYFTTNQNELAGFFCLKNTTG